MPLRRRANFRNCGAVFPKYPHAVDFETANVTSYVEFPRRVYGTVATGAAR